MHYATVTLALGVALAGGCGSPEPLAPAPDICNGSDEIRLYVADWFAGSSDAAVDYVMYAEGVRFLKIDGHCHYYVFDGEAIPWRWWQPVREGDFTAEEIEEVVERLEVARWGSFDEEELESNNSMHAAWQRFHVTGEERECPFGCPPESELSSILWEARKLTEELAAVSEPVVPEVVEAVVIEFDYNQQDVDHPLAGRWGASNPMEDYIDPLWPVDSFWEGPDKMGTMVRAADEPWFVEVSDAYREATQGHFPGGGSIPILDDNEEDVHKFFVRTVTPAFGEAP